MALTYENSSFDPWANQSFHNSRIPIDRDTRDLTRKTCWSDFVIVILITEIISRPQVQLRRLVKIKRISERRVHSCRVRVAICEVKACSRELRGKVSIEAVSIHRASLIEIGGSVALRNPHRSTIAQESSEARVVKAQRQTRHDPSPQDPWCARTRPLQLTAGEYRSQTIAEFD